MIDAREIQIGDRVLASLHGNAEPRRATVTGILESHVASRDGLGRRLFVVKYDGQHHETSPCTVRRLEGSGDSE